VRHSPGTLWRPFEFVVGEIELRVRIAAPPKSARPCSVGGRLGLDGRKSPGRHPKFQTVALNTNIARPCRIPALHLRRQLVLLDSDHP
jgi:hypothetical protein